MNFNSDHVHLILTSQYLIKFIELEKFLKTRIGNILGTVDPIKKNKLYFYHGSKAGSKVWADYQEYNLNFQTFKYKSNEKFNDFTLKSLLDFCKSEDIHIFDNFSSLKSKMTNINFYDFIKSLIEMRNVLAHEISSPSFTSKHFLELLPDKLLSDYLDSCNLKYDINDLNQNSKEILSNIIYIQYFEKLVTE